MRSSTPAALTFLAGLLSLALAAPAGASSASRLALPPGIPPPAYDAGANRGGGVLFGLPLRAVSLAYTPPKSVKANAALPCAGAPWGGYLPHPGYNFCGYVNNVRVATMSGANPWPGRCARPDIPKRDFVYCFASPCGTDEGYCTTRCRPDASNLAIWGGSDSGVPVKNVEPCPHWANYQPFSKSASGPCDPVIDPITNRQQSTPVPPPMARPVLELRYVARYPVRNGSYYALMREPGNPVAAWFFAPLTCVIGRSKPFL